MSSEALSEQSYVRKGAGYDEVYPSGQTEPCASYPKRFPSTNSPSREEDEDLNEDGSESDMDKSPLRTIVGPDDVRNFILPFVWMTNDFSSTIQRKHFNTFRDRYQIPIDVPIHLPYKFEKCYYYGATDVRMFK